MDEDVTEPTEVDSPESSVEVPQEPTGEQYTVTVNGQSEEVSLDELRDGYQRQSDYTRKTQELASERRRLQQAEAIVASLESDPQGTLSALGNAFGVHLQEAQVAEQDSTGDPYGRGYDESPEPEDKTTQRVAQLEAQVAAQDRLQRRQQVEKQVQGLQAQYGDFDAQELFQHAIRHRINNLEAALTHMRFGDVADKANKLEKEQERTEAKRDASVVEPSGSKQAGSSRKAAPEAVGSIREAFENAKRELAS